MKTRAGILAAATFSIGLIACQREEPTRTVKWFIEHRHEMDTTLAACRDNPVELTATPNCINANRAKNKVAWSAKGRGIVLDNDEKENTP